MVEFIIGQSGSGKTTLMTDRIEEYSKTGRTQCVLVPEQYSYEFDKMLYFRLGAEKFNALYSLTFTSLARQLFQLYGEHDRNGEYADEFDRMILIYQALSAVRKRPDGLRYFAKQSSCSGFAESSLKLISDLKRAGITSDELFERSPLLDGRLADKTSDIAMLYDEYERLMKEYGFKDNLDNIVKAAETAAQHTYFKGMDVFIDEFESFTGDEVDMLRVIFAEAENVIITLKTDDVDAEEFTLFETVNNTCRRLRAICSDLGCPTKITMCGESYRFKSPDLRYLSDRIMRNLHPAPENAPKADNIGIFEARDMYSEVEFVFAEIKHMLYRDKELRYGDIAIISNNIESYADILRAASERFDIPYFLSIERSVSHTPIMVFVSTMLDLVNARQIRSDQVFRLMKCGILDIPLTDVSALENYCTKWGIDGGAWCRTFRQQDDELDLYESLRDRVMKPILKLRSEAAREHSAAELCALLYDRLVECEAEKNTAAIMGRLIMQDRDYDAAELKRIWACLIDILDSITETLGDNVLTFSEFSRLIKSMAGRITYSVPPQTVDSVTIASARTARLNAPRVVFIMGATDGSFPAQVRKHDLFTESDKQKLAVNGLEISRPLSDLIASERLIVYKSLSTASERLWVCYPLEDLSGQAQYPAQAVGQILEMFGSNNLRLTSDSQLGTDFYAVTMHSAFYHYMQDRRLDSKEVSSIGKILAESPEYRQRLANVFTKSGYGKRFRVDTETMERIRNFDPLKLSPTDVDSFNKCRFMFFCEKCLHLKEYDEIKLDSRNEGSLIHSCFCNILGKHSKEEFTQLTKEQLSSEILRSSEQFLANNLAGDSMDDPRFRMNCKKVTERLVNIFRTAQRALSVTDFEPERFELKLSHDRSIQMSFGQGRKMVFNGIVDRVDTWKNGSDKYLRVIDYKSSEKTITPEELGSGINLQMLMYLFALTEKNGIYSGFKPAGVLYSPVKVSRVDTSKAKKADSSAFDSQLRPKGLVLGDMRVLSAMEEGISGKFIPASIDKNGDIAEKSSCISSEGMDELRRFVSDRLTDMADSLISGEVEPVPLVMNNGSKPCSYCKCSDICENMNAKICRGPDPELTAQAEEILGKKFDRKADNDEVD